MYVHNLSMKLRIDLIHGVLSIIFKSEANNKTRLKNQLRFEVSSNYKLRTGPTGQPVTPSGFTGPRHAVFRGKLSASPIRSLSSATSRNDGGRAHVTAFRLLMFSSSVLSKRCFYKYFKVTLVKFSLVFNKGQGYVWSWIECHYLQCKFIMKVSVCLLTVC